MEETKTKIIKTKITHYAGVLATISTEASQVMSGAWHPGPPEDMHPKRERHHLIWQRVTIGASAVLSILVLSLGVLFGPMHGSFAPVYLASVKINAMDADHIITQKIDKPIKDYKLVIQYPDKTKKSFSMEQAGISVDRDKSAVSAKKSLKASFASRLKWWEPINLPLSLKNEPVKLDAFMSTEATRVETAPVNASLGITAGVVVLGENKDGRGFIVKDALKAVPKSISWMYSEPLKLTADTLKPSITVKDLTASKKKAEGLLSQPVSFIIAGDTIKASATDVGGWIDFTPVQSSKTVDVIVNSGKVLEYINSISEDYTSPARNRTVITVNGGEVVIDKGSNGSDVLDKEKIAAQATDQLTKNQPVNAELKVQYVPAKTTSLPAYTKWIEANMSTKRMYAYEGSTLVRSFLISAGAPDTPTVVGNYKVYSKYLSQDMRGANTDGSRYFQPDVPYVLYFYGSYAVHGNYWRPASWFGNINSSHGCLGVTPGDGEWIYNWASIGTSVITHY